MENQRNHATNNESKVGLDSAVSDGYTSIGWLIEAKEKCHANFVSTEDLADMNVKFLSDLGCTNITKTEIFKRDV